MRISKTVSITLPPDMLARAIKLAKEENRTMSELIREALRKYEFERSLRRIQTSPSAQRMRAKNLTEDDIVAAVKEVRKTLWPEYKKKHGLDKPRKKEIARKRRSG